MAVKSLLHRIQPRGRDHDDYDEPKLELIQPMGEGTIGSLGNLGGIQEVKLAGGCTGVVGPVVALACPVGQ